MLNTRGGSLNNFTSRDIWVFFKSTYNFMLSPFVLSRSTAVLKRKKLPSQIKVTKIRHSKGQRYTATKTTTMHERNVKVTRHK